jgi:hypothetical protein
MKTRSKILVNLSICLVLILLLLGMGCGVSGNLKITVGDAEAIFDLRSELPTGFSFSAGGEAMPSDLLGVGSPSYFLSQGAVGEIGKGDWYQIQCALWVVGEDTASQISVEDALGEYGLVGLPETHSVSLGSSVDAVLYGDDCSGFDFLMLKYGKVFALINAWYTHPRDDCISLIDLGEVIVQRLSEYSQ